MKSLPNPLRQIRDENDDTGSVRLKTSMNDFKKKQGETKPFDTYSTSDVILPPMISTENTIESEFIKTVTELVEYYAGKRPAVDRCKTDPTGETVAGIIGFADQATRGSILLICSEFVLSNFANQHQSANTEQPGKLSMDLLGELSNQVAGRLKNRLIKYGITLKIALPMVLPGRQIEAGCIGMCKRMYRVTWPQEELHAMLCFDVESGIKLQSKGENKVATEGTIELF